MFDTLDFPFEEVVCLGMSDSSTFPEVDIFIPAICQLLEGKKLSEIGEEYTIKHNITSNHTYNGKQIIAGISHIDTYGNIILNISHDYFEAKRNHRRFVISVISSRYTVNKISKHFQDVNSNEIFALFNHLGLLEIGMKYFNMSELLNISKEDNVLIRFLD